MKNDNDGRVAGSSVGIIGGSIAGCATAIALERLGCDVTVLERSSSGLQDRGSGIAIPIALRDELIEAGYLPADYPCWPGNGRAWYVADGTDGGDLRWRQPGPMVTNNWGELWRGLRTHLATTTDYVEGGQVVSLSAGDPGVSVELDNGSSHRFDAVFGADGYRSVVRAHMHPQSRPRYAGYVLWRGNFPVADLTDTGSWEQVLATGEWITVAFDGGHAVMYPIPDFDAATHGGLRVNWAMYAPTPDGLVVDDPSSIPPGAVGEDLYRQFRELLDAVIPPDHLPLFASPREGISIQPVYDELVDHYVDGRVALIGDAATLSRPHTGSGATKAMQDARLLETLGATHDTWDALLAAYDTDRSATGRSLVELGRRIGHDQVEATPPWSTMSPSDFEAWTAATLGGESLYFWGSDDD